MKVSLPLFKKIMTNILEIINHNFYIISKFVAFKVSEKWTKQKPKNINQKCFETDFFG